MMEYPPAEQLLAILMTGPNEKLLETAADYLKEFAHRMDKRKQIQTIGPASPYVSKVKDVYRRILYLKSDDYNALIQIKDKLEQYIEINTGFKTMRIQFDFNPMNVF